MVHYVGRRGNCHYNSFLFPAYFLRILCRKPGKGICGRRDGKRADPIVSFFSKQEGSHAVLSLLRQLAELEKTKPEFYSYEVLVLLSSLWLAMRKNLTLPPEKKRVPSAAACRKSSLYCPALWRRSDAGRLGKQRNISKSECSRVSASLTRRPIKYLAEFRLSEAGRGFKKIPTGPSGDIAAAVGFHQMSHLGNFREKTGYSPGNTESQKKE